MKKRFLFYSTTFVICSLTACETEKIAPDTSLSDEIAKIETSYKEGDIKIQNSYSDKKIETIMADAEIEILKEKINSAIFERLSKMNNRFKSAQILFQGYDVGVIPNVDACPSWSEYIKFHMDCEDSSPETYWRNNGYVSDGYKGAWTIDGNKNVNLVFCRVDGRLLSTSANSQAVLRLGTNQPTGVQGIITRSFDNEDSSNDNFYVGDIGPNVSNSNTTLQFYVYQNYQGTPMPDYGFGYGVLGTCCGSGSYPNVGMLHTDDEDRRNANWMTVTNGAYSLMITPGSNTDIYIAKIRD